MTSEATKKMLEQVEQQYNSKKVQTNGQAKTETITKATANAKFANIADNPFIKVMGNEKLGPAEKKEAVKKMMVIDVTEDKSVTEERLQAFEIYKEYMQAIRKDMAVEIIKLSDTGAMSELKGVIDDLNNAMIEFDQGIAPLTSILDAVFDLRMQGRETTEGVFKEIMSDRAAEEAHAKAISDQDEVLRAKGQELDQLNGNVDQLNRDIISLQHDTNFFGRIKGSAKEAIAQKQYEIQQATGSISAAQEQLTEENSKLEALKQPVTPETQFAELAAAKEKLRQLLDITSAEHQESQKRVIDSALKFVSQADDRVAGVLTHFGKMDEQISSLDNANDILKQDYAVLMDATREASAENSKIREQFNTAAENEDGVSAIVREGNLKKVNNYISVTTNSSLETVATYTDLAKESVQILGMKDMCHDQISKTRQLKSSGIAGVASNLSAVITGISQAALNESTEMAKGAVDGMNARTSDITSKGAIRAAMGARSVADDFAKATDSLAAIKQGLDLATKIRGDAMADIKTSRLTMEATVAELASSLKKAEQVSAEADMEGTGKPAAKNDNKPAEQKAANPLARFSA